jgi:hypothetical protein
MSKHIFAQAKLTNFALERAAARLPTRAAPSRELVISLLRGRPEIQAEVSWLRSVAARRGAASAGDGDAPDDVSSRRLGPPDPAGPDAADSCCAPAHPKQPPGGATADVSRDEQLTASV